MTLTKRITENSKRIALTPGVMRFLSDDRVMKAAEGVLGARSRVKAAWKVLTEGHDLPAVDPALDDRMGETDSGPRSSVWRTNGHAGTNGHAAARGPASTEGRAGADDEAEAPGTDRPRVTGGGPAPTAATEALDQSLRDRTSLAGIGGRDVFEKCYQFLTADNARKMGMYPFFRPLDLNDGPEAVVDGKRVVMFGSNNYLGLTTHPKVREAAKAAIDRYGTSMTGSRLVNGSMKLHNVFEEKLAAFFGKESALVFTTGYQVNLATCAALLSNKRTVAVIDRNVHASLYDGVRLGQSAGARLVRYKHSDAASLDAALTKLDAGEGALVITDGVFSAEGEIARLDELVPVVKKHGARLFVDDAHALGVIGPGGRGTAHHFGLESQVDLVSGTFSKSLASIGGWLVGERKVLDYIQHFAPSFMFAASAAPPNVAAAMAAFDVMQEEPWRIDRLRENFTYMRDELTKMGFELGRTETAVIPIYIRQDLRTLMMWKELLEVHGVYTNPFISPGVPPKHAMLRTSYMATHERSHLDRGLEALHACGKKFGVI
ncbi:MAG: aminotransferase class I/II-fold pyridoxal phosphate-dependent enzyme [Deltaproteobacteria bacterium]|nr:aminotransferase class I/II-fold pyridoxal phosphate-dependent enzyme [Deltaproteobacteria bacterium]